MSRRSSVPSYTLHRPSGQARVRIGGRDIYLGPHNSQESLERYAKLIAECASKSSEARAGVSPISVKDQDLTVSELVLRFYQLIKREFGEKNKETYGIRDALRPVNQLYGSTRASEFGPKALKTVREHMIKVQNLCRTEINRRMSRIRRAFKWAESEELIPAGHYHTLQTVSGLRLGRSEARESEPVKPVDAKTVASTMPFLSPTVAAMVRLQQLTGMRQGEICIMRPLDLDRTGDIWVYQPSTHKTAHLGTIKQIPLGPLAQQVIKPFLDREPETFLFSPIESEEWRNEQRSINRSTSRKTKIYPCELRARLKRKTKKKATTSPRARRRRYDSDSYRRAISYGIQKARKAGVEVENWHPH
ncbi:MAG: site-specific integrase, partial [Planctomycetes bacterium]|nr:site-specific integrase [Planctomycetota bacterium]